MRAADAPFEQPLEHQAAARLGLFTGSTGGHANVALRTVVLHRLDDVAGALREDGDLVERIESHTVDRNDCVLPFDGAEHGRRIEYVAAGHLQTVVVALHGGRITREGGYYVAHLQGTLDHETSGVRSSGRP